MLAIREAQGKWNCVQFWYRLPEIKSESTPKQICYTFTGNSEVCVNGDSYEIKLGGWTTTEHPIANFSPLGYCTPWNAEYWILNSGGFVIRKNAFGVILNEYAPSSVDNDPNSDYTFTVAFTFNDSTTCGQTLTYYNQLKNGVMFAPSEWGYAPAVPTLKFYPTKINIKNNNGDIIQTIEGNRTPTVAIKNAIETNTCRFTAWVYAHDEWLAPSDRVVIDKRLSEGKKRTIVLIQNGVNRVQIRLIFLKDGICNYPDVKVIPCKPEKPPEENCPSGTCIECINGDFKCCYDGHLRLIKSIRL